MRERDKTNPAAVSTRLLRAKKNTARAGEGSRGGNLEPGECLALPRREIWGAREQLHPPEGDLSSCSIPKDAESTLGMLGGSWGGLQEEIPAAAPPAPILIPKGFPGVRSLEHFPHDFSVPSHSQGMSWVLPDAELITAVRSEEHKHE